MAQLLLEVGCEELPASAVERAFSELRDKLAKAVEDARLGSGLEWTAIGTPRRLIVSVEGIGLHQNDEVKEVRGPSVKAAFDAEGKPTPALLGYCRSNGVEVSSLRRDDQYVWASKTIAGRPSLEVLAEAIPAAIRSLSFDKTMRWGSGRQRFARPIRWLLATLDGQLIPFEIEGVASGTSSRGHRFYSPEPFTATNLSDLVDGLRERKVEPDPALRRKRILEGTHEVAGAFAEIHEALVDENVYLTEWPTPIRGTFKEEFLELPEPVLVTAMAKHEKMFPIRNEDGTLINSFVFVRNSGEDDTVRKGSEWVLNARFNDAKFFFDEDKRFTLDEFLARTSGILFQEKLGSVRDRADRLSKLASIIAQETGGTDEEIESARVAGLYAKADLSTGLVSELASLQGIIGGHYARREGHSGAVAWAIATQYDHSKNEDPSNCDGERTSLRLITADQLDKLAGYLGLGLEPTGSSDPYGLRRAATILIESAWAWPRALPAYDGLLDAALRNYAEQDIQLDAKAAHASVWDLFRSRYSALLNHVRYDVLEAAVMAEIPWESTLPRNIRFRAEVMTQLAGDSVLVQTATRPINIVSASRKKGIEYGFDDPLTQLKTAKLNSPEGESLLAQLRQTEEPLFIAAREHHTQSVVKIVSELMPYINRFIDNNMVMDEDPGVRFARLTLMHATALQLLVAGDFSKLVIDG